MVRLIGVGVSSLVPNSDLRILSVPPQAAQEAEVQFQLPLDRSSSEDDRAETRHHASLDASMDHIRKRFGFGAIGFGVSLAMSDNDDGWREAGRE
jgi:hypothetical protein